MLHRRSAKLARWQIMLLSLSGGGLWLTGLIWVLLHHFGQREGEFGPELNPFEPLMMKIHGFALIPALLGIGGMFIAHIPKGWDHTHQRVAGIALCVVLTILIGTGYMLYYVGDQVVREWASISHWTVGLTAIAVFTWHYVNGLAARRRS